jgi:hypothetical protein
MPRKRTAIATDLPDRYFVKELAGENPPSFAAMQRLYELASKLYGVQPWGLLDESQLILVRDSVSGELCYCSVMGMLGEVYSVHAYIGTESLRLFRRMQAEQLTDAGEFFATQHSVSMEFVRKAELERQDRELLAALGHPQGRGLASPIFRTIRPGFHPWFVTEEEARTLAECIGAVIVICAAVASQESTKFWDLADTYPMVTRMEGAEPRYRVDLVKAVLPAEPPILQVRLEEATLRRLRSQDYMVRGVMELDHILTGTPIGKKGERSASAAIALAVDAESGVVLAPDAHRSSVAAGDALARVFLNAVQANHTLPKEVRVRCQRLKECLTPLMESFGVAIRVAGRLPAADEARSSLLGYLQVDARGR